MTDHPLPCRFCGKSLKANRWYHERYRCPANPDREPRPTSPCQFCGKAVPTPHINQHEKRDCPRNPQRVPRREPGDRRGEVHSAVRPRLDLVRQLFERGATDREIAKVIGAPTKAVQRGRLTLGLRRQVNVLLPENCEKAQDYAKGFGWPDDLQVRAVQILTLLWEVGPMTRQDLLDQMGLKQQTPAFHRDVETLVSRLLVLQTAKTDGKTFLVLSPLAAVNRFRSEGEVV